MTRWMWTTLVAVAAAAIGYWLGKPGSPITETGTNSAEQTSTRPPAEKRQAAEPGSSLPPLFEAAVTKLGDGGWDEEAARVVVAFYRDWLTALFDADRDAYDRVLIALCQLPHAGELRDVLRDRPEYAGLLLLVSDPHALARELRGPDRDLLAGLFLIHLDRRDADVLAASLPDNSDLIAGLYRRGLLGAEVLFMFPRGTQASREYEMWLRGAMREAVRLHDDQLVGMVLLLLEEGPSIRRRMAEDDQFRLRFGGLWAKLKRAVGKRGEDLGQYVNQPGLWDFLSGPDSEILIEKWGLLPVDLLHSPGTARYPPQHHARVVELLKVGDQPVADLLRLCRGESAFYPFLEKNLSPDLLCWVYWDLDRHKDTLRHRLEVLQKKLNESVDRLREEVGQKEAGPKEYLPFYSLYKVFETYSDGEDPSALDLLFAAADVGTVVMPAGRFMVVAGKEGGRGVAKEVLQGIVRKEVDGLVKGRLRGEAAKFGAVAANRHAVRLAVQQRLVEAVRAVREAFARGLPRVEVKLDVTEPLLYVYRHSGLGRDPFRRLTGLDPRVLLTREGRVYLQLRWSEAIISKRQAALLTLRKYVDRVTDDRDGHQTPGVGRSGGDHPRDTGPGYRPHQWATQAGILWLASAADLLATDESPAGSTRP